MMRVTLAAAVMLCAGPARSQPETPYTVSYFIAHDAARRVALAWCGDSADREDLPTCRNAQAASAGRQSSALASNDPMMDPDYWRQNWIAAQGVVQQCQLRRRGDQIVYRYCGAAAQGLASR